ncbi:MAG TPA: hypothetical protein VLB07_10480, partial [Woeseiaceae bacterium]|nr:hypothetical protein [Woeseiaceae bacterium]
GTADNDNSGNDAVDKYEFFHNPLPVKGVEKLAPGPRLVITRTGESGQVIRKDDIAWTVTRLSGHQLQ